MIGLLDFLYPFVPEENLWVYVTHFYMPDASSRENLYLASHVPVMGSLETLMSRDSIFTILILILRVIVLVCQC